MFPPRYFPPRCFAPRHFPPGDPAVPWLSFLYAWQPQQTLLLKWGTRSMPSEKTIRLIRGQDLVLRGILCPPGDLSEWTLAFTIRDGPAGAVILSKSNGSGIILANRAEGVVHVQLAKDDLAEQTESAALPAGKGYLWDLKRIDAGCNVVLARGQLVLEREITS